MSVTESLILANMTLVCAMSDFPSFFPTPLLIVVTVAALPGLGFITFACFKILKKIVLQVYSIVAEKVTSLRLHVA